MAEEQPSLLHLIEARVRWRLHLFRRRAIEILRPLLPSATRRALRWIDRQLDPIHIALHRIRTGRADPIPPRLLRERVGALTIDTYFHTGEVYAEAVRAGLAVAGRTWADCQRGLDFGCGAGKVLQQLQRQSAVDWHGCDIDAASISWAQKNLPQVTAAHTGFTPPLPYRDGFFDCVFGWSVFTHLDESMQLDWLDELHRILAPSGVLLLSVLGENPPASAEVGMTPDPERLQADGLVFMPYDSGGASYREFTGTESAAYGLTFLTGDYVRAKWPDPLELVSIEVRALDSLQDIVVLRRRPNDSKLSLSSELSGGDAGTD
jgi:SAM-dependent methyltransferase